MTDFPIDHALCNILFFLYIVLSFSALCRDPLIAVALSDNTARVLSKSTLQHVGTFKGKSRQNLMFTSYL